MLFIIYTTGRFGPERILGHVVAKNNECLRQTTYITWDIIGKVDNLNNLAQQVAECRTIHITNPEGINGLREYRKWQRTHSS